MAAFFEAAAIIIATSPASGRPLKCKAKVLLGVQSQGRKARITVVSTPTHTVDGNLGFSHSIQHVMG
jgi:hypothetical protein